MSRIWFIGRNLERTVIANRAGTPGDDDYIISFDVTFAAGMGQERHGPFTAHKLCDEFIQTYRDKLKSSKGISVRNVMNIMIR